MKKCTWMKPGVLDQHSWTHLSKIWIFLWLLKMVLTTCNRESDVWVHGKITQIVNFAFLIYPGKNIIIHQRHVSETAKNWDMIFWSYVKHKKQQNSWFSFPPIIQVTFTTKLHTVVFMVHYFHVLKSSSSWPQNWILSLFP